MEMLSFFSIFVVIFAILDPDPATPINADPCGSRFKTLPGAPILNSKPDLSSGARLCSRRPVRLERRRKNGSDWNSCQIWPKTAASSGTVSRLQQCFLQK
jgi:hypothetical protein